MTQFHEWDKVATVKWADEKVENVKLKAENERVMKDNKENWQSYKADIEKLKAENEKLKELTEDIEEQLAAVECLRFMDYTYEDGRWFDQDCESEEEEEDIFKEYNEKLDILEKSTM